MICIVYKYLVCAFVGQACSTIGWSNRGKLNGKKNSGTVQCVTSQSGHSACVSSNYLARRTMESNEVEIEDAPPGYSRVTKRPYFPGHVRISRPVPGVPGFF